MDITLKEVQDKKDQLEESILDLVENFRSETGLVVYNIETEHIVVKRDRCITSDSYRLKVVVEI